MKVTKVICVVASLVIAILFCFGNAMAAEKGPIHFVMLTDLTGPAHALVAGRMGCEDTLWLNKNGGINGHPL